MPSYYFSILLIVAATSSLFTKGSCLACNDPYDLSSGTCAQLSKELERALVQDEGNLFRLRSMFRQSPTAAPILLKVLYNVTFAEDFIDAAAAEEVPNCYSPTLNSSIELTQTNITLGWTSTGVYVVFHPTLLSMMQIQSPFALLRIFHLTLNQRSPEADSFLWDGSYDLPTVQLNLYITSLSCVPSYDLFESLLIEMNALLKIYGAQQQAIQEISAEQVNSIGYTIPGTHVSSEVIPIGSDVIFINLYTSILCILHTISVCIIIVCYFPNRSSYRVRESNNGSKQSDVKKFIDELIGDERYDDLLVGVRITSNTTLIVEVLIRLIAIIIWTQNSRDIPGTFLAVWLPNLLLLAVSILLNVVLNVCIIRNEGCKNCCCNSSSGGLRTFFTLYGTVFILLYFFFPTIVLTFAYPTQMIVIFAFVIAYLFATSVFSAGIVKLFRYNNNSKRKDDQDKSIELQNKANKDENANQYSQEEQQRKSVEQSETCCYNGFLNRNREFFYHFFVYFMPLWIVILYLHLLMLYILYMLMIGRGTVITTGPAFIISLFTPALLSSIAAAVLKKSTIIKEAKDEEE